MNEFSDWIWIAVAGIWIVTRILPKLLGSKPQRTAPTPPPNASTSRKIPTTPKPEWEEGFGHKHATSKAPPPIQPR